MFWGDWGFFVLVVVLVDNCFSPSLSKPTGKELILNLGSHIQALTYSSHWLCLWLSVSLFREQL